MSSILRYDERQIKDGARSPLPFLREALGSSGRMSANPLRMSNSLLSARSYMVEDTPKSDFRDEDWARAVSKRKSGNAQEEHVG